MSVHLSICSLINVKTMGTDIARGTILNARDTKVGGFHSTYTKSKKENRQLSAITTSVISR